MLSELSHFVGMLRGIKHCAFVQIFNNWLDMALEFVTSLVQPNRITRANTKFPNED